MPVNMQRRALIGLGLLWLGGAPAFAATDVTGLWSAAIRTGKGGVTGDQMVFTPTEVILTNGILADATYEIDETKLTMTPVDKRHGPPQVCEFEVEANTMTMTFADGKSRLMTRLGAPHEGAHPMIGDWTWPLL